MNKRVSQARNPGRILPPNLLLPVAVLGIVVVAATLYLEYQSRKQDYIRLLENQAVLFVRTLTNTAQNAFTAAGELEEEISNQMIASLRLIEQLDRSRSFSTEELKALIPIARFDEIQLYNNGGVLIKTVGTDSTHHERIPAHVLQAAQKRNFQRMIYTFPEAERSNHDQLAAIIPRKKGGVMAGIVNANRIQAFRKLFGFGYFLKRFQASDNVRYIVLQNPQTIVAGIFPGYDISSFPEDPYLEHALREGKVKTRILDYPLHVIFEAVAPFSFGGEPFGLLRLGLSMGEYELLEAQAKRRLYIFGGVLIVLGLIGLSFVRAYQHRQRLSRDIGQLREEQLRRNETLTATRKLASTVAHEIRNPLNSINLIIDLIKKRYSPAEDADIYQQNIKTVQGEIVRISTIVEEFIRFARLPKARFIPIDFPKFFSEIEILVSTRLEEEGIKATFTLSDHPTYHGDPEQLKQTFTNLIYNAIDAITPPGEIAVTGRTSGDGYEISVSDTGCGISDEDLAQIFDLSFTTKPHGNGIGLAVVHQIVTNHRGVIKADSAEGEGATFRIWLPFDVEGEHDEAMRG